MNDERLAGIMEIPKNAFLKELAKRSIFVIEPNTEKYDNDPDQIEMYGERTISFNLLIDMLNDSIAFSKINKLYTGEEPQISIYFMSDIGEYRKEFRITGKSLIELLEKRIFDLPPNIYDIYHSFVKQISFDNFKQEKLHDTYQIQIDNNDYNIPVEKMLSIVELDEQNFLERIKDKTIDGIPTNYYLYAIKTYFKANQVLDKYLLSPQVEDRIKKISNYQYLDFEAVNRVLKKDDFNFDSIHVNEELKQKILEGIPEELTPLEKAIYIYIKMCKMLTYDEEFYALNQRGPVVAIHEDINHVSQITITNNKVVCYEFNAIYEKMLAEIGINFETDQKLLNGFGGGHANLIFRSDKFLIQADSVTSILQGDIFQAKLNQPLRGLVCKNKNPNTVKEFQDILTKMYFLVASKEQQLTANKVEEVESFEEILEQYTERTDNLRPIPLEEKMAILVDKVNATRMIGIDAYSYILQLRKIIFSEQEQKDNFRISIIRNTEKQGEENLTTAKAIFALRIPIEDKHVIKYYIYSPGEQLKPINKEELQERFERNELGYVNKDDPIIPGLGGKK